MRHLILLIALAGCAAEANYIQVPPESRLGVLKAFNASNLEDPKEWAYGRPQKTVIVVARGPDGTNAKASRLWRDFRSLDDAEHSALHHCGLYKKDDETCFVVYKGGWIED